MGSAFAEPSAFFKISARQDGTTGARMLESLKSKTILITKARKKILILKTTLILFRVFAPSCFCDEN